MKKYPPPKGEQIAMHIIANVLDQQAEEEPNLWYRWQKRKAAVQARAFSRLPPWLVRRNQKDEKE